MTRKTLAEQKKIGILYSEDFEKTSIEKIIIKIPEDSSNIEKEELFSKSFLDKYYEDGFQNGIKEEKKNNNIEKDFIESLLNVFHSMEKEILEQKKQISKEISFAIIYCIANLFPNLYEKYGEKDSEIIFQKIYPFINKNSYVNLSCSKQFFFKIEELVPESFKETINLNIDEAMKNGEFSIVWDTGSLSRNSSKYIEKIISEILCFNKERKEENARER